MIQTKCSICGEKYEMSKFELKRLQAKNEKPVCLTCKGKKAAK